MRVSLLALGVLFCCFAAAQDKEKEAKKEDKKEEKKDGKPKEGKKDDKPKEGKKDDKKDDKKVALFDFPLKEGTKWTYRVGDNRYVVTLSKFEDVGKTKCARLDMTINDKAASFEHVAVGPDKDGISSAMRYTFEGKVANPPITFLQLPENKTSWRVESKLDGQTLKGLFRKSEEDVKVPAGEYKKAAKVAADNLKVNGVDMVITYWFAPGVGLVKQEAELAGQRVIIELEKYEPGK